jgi:hypothetical protein
VVIAGVSAKNGSPWAPGVVGDGRDRFVVQTYGTGEQALITRIRYYAVTPDLWRARIRDGADLDQRFLEDRSE